jgi:hypothetical protein
VKEDGKTERKWRFQNAIVTIVLMVAAEVD